MEKKTKQGLQKAGSKIRMSGSFFLLLQAVHLVVPRPPPERLPVEPEQDAEGAPQRRERHVEHDRWDVARADDPRCHELGEPVAPEVLVDGDGDEDAAGDGLVRVDGIGGGDAGDGGDLDTGARVADDDDDAPVPRVLVADSVDDVAENHDEHVGDHGHEAHLWLTDAVVALGELHRDPIREGAGRGEPDKGADEEGEVEEACWRKVG